MGGLVRRYVGRLRGVCGSAACHRGQVAPRILQRPHEGSTAKDAATAAAQPPRSFEGRLGRLEEVGVDTTRLEGHQDAFAVCCQCGQFCRDPQRLEVSMAYYWTDGFSKVLVALVCI